MAWMYWTFLGIVVFFHVSEFLLTWIYHRESVSRDSLLFSWPYVVMLGLATGEFWLEYTFSPVLKLPPVCLLGIGLCVAGEGVRKAAMITAGRAFTHQIAERKRAAHRLVTGGVYRVARHPAYLGWFWWAAGAQLVLCNPLTTALTVALAWRFFAHRIPLEETHLKAFFGDAYDAYRRRTPTWLPWIP
jgi:protein-S-isoprenylcysteine O-methyltransferase